MEDWRPDRDGVGVCEDSHHAYIGNALRDDALAVPAACGEDGVLRVDVRLFAQAYPGTEVEAGEGNRWAQIRVGGECFTLVDGHQLMLRGDRMLSIPPPRLQDGVLTAPFCAVERIVFGRHARQRSGAAYSTGHPFALTFDLAYTLQLALGARKEPGNREVYAWEDRLLRMQCAERGLEIPEDREALVDLWCHT